MEGPFHVLPLQPDFQAMANEHRALATNHGLIADQFERFTGIPALNQGQEILNVLRRLTQQVGGIQNELKGLKQEVGGLKQGLGDLRKEVGDLKKEVGDLKQGQGDLQQKAGDMKTRLDHIDARLDHIDARFDPMEQRIQMHIAASENNGIARMRNARADRADYRLVPLYAISTNNEIEDFPKTLGDIDKLETPALNNIYSLLGHPRPGNIYSKRRGLKKLAGVFHQDLHDDPPPQPSQN